MRPRRPRRGEGGYRRTDLRAEGGFNAATATSPWRGQDYRAAVNLLGLLQCGHGDLAVEREIAGREHRVRPLSFNAATATSPWRGAAPAAANNPAFTLQCGHGDLAVERLGGGVSPAGRDVLQCGHGDLAVERVEAALALRPELRLQCGHGDLAVERLTTVNQLGGTLEMLQCGHGDLAVERAPRQLRRRRRQVSFNAATATSPWRGLERKTDKDGRMPALQ